MKHILKTIREILSLETVRIRLGSTEESKWIRGIFTKPHPRYRIIPNKGIGVELIKAYSFASPADYVKSVSGKNSAAYFSRKAVKAGYRVERFDPNDRLDEIFEINTSKEMRQGQPMTEGYLSRPKGFQDDDLHPHYGVFGADGVLRGYISLYFFEELTLINRIIGHGDHLNAGIMYLLGTEVVKSIIQEKKAKYIMYDTFFGAQDGLKLFKGRLGFRPYRVKWC